ncbi:CnrY/NccY family anti-sigma factor [Rhodoferax sp. BAB1]|jgi:hypothetical protein|uniref:CnrY/NccY family anti-sigma factor n=1 Tax=Rhodoferax sp. BAB1 TaxID=2741720 RepID=UPI0015752E8C|nr:CnrY/NccY family anti-sigma factor [Rhodoferax sp. BAB1]QKO20555.1 CnrY/NccY family anti-sigma factor [Rhodoferax sp. BAB1]
MTDDVDKWLANAKAVTATGAQHADVRSIHRKLDADGLGSVLALSRRDMRLIVACAVISAVVTIWASTQFAGKTPRPASATWIANPSPISPFGLLVGG